MPTAETLRSQADRLSLSEGSDYTIKLYTERGTRKKMPIIQLTSTGKSKRDKIAESLFPNEPERHFSLPLGKNFLLKDLHVGDIITLDGSLALSLIRRRTGGYVCSFTDDFELLDKQVFRARIQKIDHEKKMVRVLFDHWPYEYIKHAFLEEKPSLIAVNEPVSIGPEALFEFAVLQDGTPHENLLLWARNVIRRNLFPKKQPTKR